MSTGYDTIFAAQLLDEQQPGSLLNQASMRLGVEDWGKGNQQFGIDADVDDLLELLDRPGKGGLGHWYGNESLGWYCARDTGYTHLLYEKTKSELVADQAQARIMKHLMLPGIDAFSRIERNGIHIHWDLLDKRDAELVARIEDLTAEIFRDHVNEEFAEEWREKLAKRQKKDAVPKPMLQNDGFLRDWIFLDERGLQLNPVAYTATKKEPKVDEKSLSQLDHPAVELVKLEKKARKGRQFFASWREWQGTDGRLHPYFNLTGTVTGRRSCQNPNLQQVPRDAFMRTVLGAPEGKVFIEVDFAQMEVRLAAWEAGCQPMIDLFNRGDDPYMGLAREVTGKAEVSGEERQRAKASVLGFLYGMLAKSFRAYAKDMYDVDFTEQEAEDYRDGFFTLYPEFVQWHERRKRQVNQTGSSISLLGRKRHLDDIYSIKNTTQWKAERQAINSPIQGFGGDWTLAAAIELDEMMLAGDLDGVMIVGDIHDAMLFEIDEDVWRERARVIMQVMERPRIITETFKLEPPLKIVAEGSVGHSWKAGNEFLLDEVDTVEVADWAA